MENIIRNLIVTDVIANHNVKYHKQLEELQYITTGYHIFSPNFIIAAMTTHNIFEIQGQPSLVLKIFLSCIEEIIKNNIVITNKIINENIINFIQLNGIGENNEISFFGYDKIYYDSFLNKKINKKNNNIFLLEIAILISLFIDDFDTLINFLVKYISAITNNTIKILSFISIGIFGFYAKEFYKTKNSIYEPNKWMDRLLDLFINNTIDTYLNIKINYTDKKKFMFMLIKYLSNISSNKYDQPYQRIRELNDCFCVKIEDTERFIPGFTADQLFIISYDFFKNSQNWLHLISFNCLTYTELKRVNFISSWYYFLINPDNKMFLRFDILNDVKEIDEFVTLLNTHVLNKTH